MFYTDITFASEAPSLQLVVETLRKNTGLIIQTGPDEQAKYFYSPTFKREKIRIMIKDNEMRLIRNNYSYLEYATLAALISLGGQIEEEIPDWAWKKWGEFTVPPQYYDYGNKMLVVYFMNSPPAPETVLEKLMENTQLVLSLRKYGKYYRFVHSTLAYEEVELYSFNEQLVICTEDAPHKYVVESIIAALVDLGGEYIGEYNMELPPQAWQPWEEAQKYYQN